MPDSVIPDQLPPDVGLAERHRALLVASAIDLAVAAESGCVTVSSASDLPEELASFASAVPGLLFAHHPLGGGAPVPQLRPDEPIEGGGKYLFPRGATPVISCHPRMAARADDASRALIVEGTKQYLAAVSAAPDDTLVVGIAGCRGWSHGGVPLPELAKVACRPDGQGRSVAICFDADITRNASVHDAAKSLGAHLSATGATEVRYVVIPAEAEAKTGLDDYLAVVPDRATTIARLVAAAPTKLGRRPAEKKRLPVPSAGNPSNKEAMIDEAAGYVRLPDRMLEDRIVPGEILLRAAPVIVETFSQIDDLDGNIDAVPVTGHRVEVAIGTGDTRRSYPVIGPVWDSELTSVSSWLARTPGGVGSTVAPLAGPMVTSMIAGAMRRHNAEGRRWVKVLSRTGWIRSDDDGPWVYAHSNGAIAATGHRDDVRSSLGQFIGWGPEDLAIDPVKAIRAVLGVADMLVDPTPWWAAMSLMAHTLAGGVPSGALNLRGKQGSGKSTIANLVASALGRRYIDQPMCVFTGSDAGRRTLGAGLHHCMIVIDDMPPAGSRREASEQAAALSSLARRSYDGGAAGEERGSWSQATGRTTRAPKDLTRPQMLLTAEVLPDGLADSTRARIIQVGVSEASTWKKGAWLKKAMPLGTEGYMAAWAASFVRFVASEIDRRGEDAWSRALTDPGGDDDKLVGLILPENANGRSREVLRPLMVGLAMLEAHADQLGIPHLDGYLDEAVEAMKAVGNNYVRDAQGGSAGQRYLEELQGLVASNRVEVGDVGMDHATFIGRKVTVGGQEAMAIIASAASAMIPDTSRTTIQHALASAGLLMIPPGGGATHCVRGIGGREEPVRCWLIPYDKWSLDEEEEAR